MAETGMHALDDNTLVACTILSAAIDRLAGRSSLVSSAIRTAISTRQPRALDMACRAFNTLDPNLRRRIADSAEGGAMSLRVRLPRFLLAPHEASPPRPIASPETLRAREQGATKVAPLANPWLTDPRLADPRLADPKLSNLLAPKREQ